MARADFFEAQTAHGPKPQSSPVTVTGPAIHAKNKAQPAQNLFFLRTFNQINQSQRDFKKC